MKFQILRGLVVAGALLFGCAPVWAAPTEPQLKSSSVLVMDEETGEILYSRNADAVLPIASITKLVTAMVILDAKLPLDETVRISNADVDLLKGTRSRLRVGTELSRDDLLKLALMASENRAASALGGSYPEGREAFVEAMNKKVLELGMRGTYFVEPTGLSSSNVSTAEDLGKLVRAAQDYPLIREYSTLSEHRVAVGKRKTAFANSNSLVRSGKWEIGLQKTGYISEAGRCMVLQAKVAARSVVIVLLDSWGKYTRAADANRIRHWLDPEFVVPAEPKKKYARAKSRSSKTVAARKSKSPIKITRTSGGRVQAKIDSASAK